MQRVRQILSERSDVDEKPIVGGGLGFMVNGHLCAGVSPRGLTVRVGPEGKSAAVKSSHVRPLILGNRETKAFVVVEPEGITDDAELGMWLDRGLTFVDSLD